MQPREKLQQIHNARRTMQTSISQDNLRPPNISRGQNPNSITPSLSLMVAPHNEWGYTPGQQQGMHFSPEKITPVSAVESVFELSSAMTNDSPNSAVSSLIAELEDTSPGAAKPQNYNMDKKSPLSPTLSVSFYRCNTYMSPILIDVFSYTQLLLLVPSMTSRRRTNNYLNVSLLQKMLQRFCKSRILTSDEKSIIVWRGICQRLRHQREHAQIMENTTLDTILRHLSLLSIR